MIDKERYEALIDVAIDPRLFRSEEVDVVGPEFARNPHQTFDRLRAEYGD